MNEYVCDYGGYELNKMYYCAYWQQNHLITKLHPPTESRGWFVTPVWDDGTATVHCTAMSARDKEVVSV